MPGCRFCRRKFIGAGKTLRKLGIVGGASWSSTALYYDHINKGVGRRLGGLHSARLVLESIDMEDDYVAFHRTNEWDRANATVVDAAKRLKLAGAEGLLLASNTFHKAADAAISATGLPIIVAVTSLAVSRGEMTSVNASVAVAAGAATVLLCPLLATLVLGRSTAERQSQPSVS